MTVNDDVEWEHKDARSLKNAYWETASVSPLSCVLCSRLLCPYLVCFLSLFSVIIRSFLPSCVCLLSMIFLYIKVHVCLVSVFWSTSYNPCVPVCLSLALLDLLKTVNLGSSSSPCSSFLPAVCTVTHGHSSSLTHLKKIAVVTHYCRYHNNDYKDIFVFTAKWNTIYLGCVKMLKCDEKIMMISKLSNPIS